MKHRAKPDAQVRPQAHADAQAGADAPALAGGQGPAGVVFEPAFTEGLVDIFERRIVFNQVLGLRVTEVLPDRVMGGLEMRPELVGHYAYNRVHGGVISACLDALGGLAVMAAMGARHMDESVEQRLQRFARLGTIDLRVDYLRPGIGERFVLKAEVLRLGSRVASTRMDFLHTNGTLLASAAAAYIVS